MKLYTIIAALLIMNGLSLAYIWDLTDGPSYTTQQVHSYIVAAYNMGREDIILEAIE